MQREQCEERNLDGGIRWINKTIGSAVRACAYICMYLAESIGWSSKHCRFVAGSREYSSLLFRRLKAEKEKALKKETERERRRKRQRENEMN